MDKQKQIEEMSKDLKEEKLYALINKTSYMRSAENLINAGYRKIPENAVVLTVDKIAEYEKGFRESWENDMKKVRKETAEKFAERLKAMAYQSTDWSHGEHPMVVEVDYIDEICEEITEGKV